MALTSKQKRDALRGACDQAVKTLEAVEAQIKATRPAGAYAPSITSTIGALNKVLAETKPRDQMSKAEKEQAKAAKRFEKRNAKMVSWLKLDGIKKGGHGERKSNGEKVEFMSDPASVPEGITISIRKADGTVLLADALEFRPDFTVATAPDLSRATVSKTHGKGKGAAA